MTTLYSNDFEGSAHLATLSEFTILAGGNYIVIDEGSFGAMPAAQGAKSFCTNDDGYRNYWNGGSAIGDQLMSSSSSLVTGHCIGHLLRVDIAGNDRHYFCLYEYSGGNLRGTVIERNNGLITQSSSSYNIAASSGDIIMLESSAIGSTIEVRVWNVTTGGTRPSTATASLTSTTYTTGYQGLRKAGANGTYASADELLITDAASAATLDQHDFRFGYDDGAENAHTHAAAQGANVTAPASQALLLNFLVDMTGDPGATTLKLQVALDGTSDWTDVPVQ